MENGFSEAVKLHRLSNRIFFTTLFGQSLLAILIFGITTSSWLQREAKSNHARVTASFSQSEKKITEAVYIDGILKSTTSTKNAIAGFESSLADLGLENALVKVGSCDQTPMAIKFQLTMGHEALSKCVFVELASSSLWGNISGSLLVIALSIVVIGLGWVAARGKFHQTILSPLLNSLEEKTRQATLSALAAQVAHDIRSPLSLISVIAHQETSMAPDKRDLLLLASRRIDEIAGTLLAQRRAIVKNSVKEFDLVAVVKNLVKEKHHVLGKKQFISFRCENKNIFLNGEAQDLSRALSNIINNAVEASHADAQITIGVVKKKTRTQLWIEDDGPGFPQVVLDSAGSESVSVGKDFGNGLGLLSAFQAVKKVGGSMRLQNLVHGGARVDIEWS